MSWLTRTKDEADFEETDHSLSSSDALRLAVAARIVEDMRLAVYEDTGFRCSAGVSHNKVGFSMYGPGR